MDGVRAWGEDPSERVVCYCECVGAREAEFVQEGEGVDGLVESAGEAAEDEDRVLLEWVLVSYYIWQDF